MEGWKIYFVYCSEEHNQLCYAHKENEDYWHNVGIEYCVPLKTKTQDGRETGDDKPKAPRYEGGICSQQQYVSVDLH